LFSELLRALGFRVQLYSARAANNSGGYGPEFDHMLVSVGLEERWLADVGFGDSFLEPLRLDATGEQVDNGRPYTVERDGERRVLLRIEDGVWKPKFVFSEQPRELSEFAGMCHYHQTSPESHFTRSRVCTRATPQGRITLADLRLIITTHEGRQERLLESEDEYRAALREYFGIELPVATAA
jgi:N-hydroxyarylamine O-acetyltransferase